MFLTGIANPVGEVKLSFGSLYIVFLLLSIQEDVILSIWCVSGVNCDCLLRFLE